MQCSLGLPGSSTYARGQVTGGAGHGTDLADSCTRSCWDVARLHAVDEGEADRIFVKKTDDMTGLNIDKRKFSETIVKLYIFILYND